MFPNLLKLAAPDRREVKFAAPSGQTKAIGSKVWWYFEIPFFNDISKNIFGRGTPEYCKWCSKGCQLGTTALTSPKIKWDAISSLHFKQTKENPVIPACQNSKTLHQVPKDSKPAGEWCERPQLNSGAVPTTPHVSGSSRAVSHCKRAVK